MTINCCHILVSRIPRERIPHPVRHIRTVTDRSPVTTLLIHETSVPYFIKSNTSILCSYNFKDSILLESSPRNRTFSKIRPYFIFFLKNLVHIFCRIQKMHYICIRNQATRALSSAGSEHLVYTQRVGGSNPSAPTKEVQKNLFFIAPNFSRESKFRLT